MGGTHLKSCVARVVGLPKHLAFCPDDLEREQSKTLNYIHGD